MTRLYRKRRQFCQEFGPELLRDIFDRQKTDQVFALSSLQLVRGEPVNDAANLRNSHSNLSLSPIIIFRTASEIVCLDIGEFLKGVRRAAQTMAPKTAGTKAEALGEPRFRVHEVEAGTRLGVIGTKPSWATNFT